MNKEESSDDLDNHSSEEINETETIEKDNVSLSEYEKVKDDYLRLAADFDNYKKRSEKETLLNLFFHLLIILKLPCHRMKLIKKLKLLVAY